jgi:hypothetical protein
MMGCGRSICIIALGKDMMDCYIDVDGAVAMLTEEK